MVAWSKLSSERRTLLEGIVVEFAHNYGRGRTILAVDGPGGAGKTLFADDLASAFRRAGHEVFRASMDAFHRPRELRYARGRFSPEGCYHDSFDYSLLRRVLVEPFRMGGSTGFVTAAFDVDRDAPLEPKWLSGPPDAVLIIDGVFLNRPELRDLWNYSIWLDADPDVRAARLLARDGVGPGDELAERAEGAQRLYVTEAHPNTRASAIIDNSDDVRPVRRFADYCSVAPLPKARARAR